MKLNRALFMAAVVDGDGGDADIESIPMDVCRGINSISSSESCCGLIVGACGKLTLRAGDPSMLWKSSVILKQSKNKIRMRLHSSGELYLREMPCVRGRTFPVERWSYCTQWDSVGVHAYHCLIQNKERERGDDEQQNTRERQNI